MLCVVPRFGDQAHGTSLLDPLLWRQGKAVQAHLDSNPLEFEGIHPRVIEPFLDAGEFSSYCGSRANSLPTEFPGHIEASRSRLAVLFQGVVLAFADRGDARWDGANTASLDSTKSSGIRSWQTGQNAATNGRPSCWKRMK